MIMIIAVAFCAFSVVLIKKFKKISVRMLGQMKTIMLGQCRNFYPKIMNLGRQKCSPKQNNKHYSGKNQFHKAKLIQTGVKCAFRDFYKN